MKFSFVNDRFMRGKSNRREREGERVTEEKEREKCVDTFWCPDLGLDF